MSAKEKAKESIEVSSLLSNRDYRGLVAIQIGGQRAVLQVEEARELGMSLIAAAQAAQCDEFLFAYVTGSGAPTELAVQALQDFRQFSEHAVDKTRKPAGPALGKIVVQPPIVEGGGLVEGGWQG